jgi:AhpC/TSA family
VKRLSTSRRLAGSLSLVLLCAQIPLRSEEIGIGSHVRAFELQNLRGKSQAIRPGGGRVTAVLFFSTRCPLSSAFNYRRNVLYHDFHTRVRFLLVDPNANESLAEVRAYTKQSGFDLPVYRDPEGTVAALLAIRATTDTLVVDQQGTVRYRGNVENAPNPERATQHGLRTALEAVLSGQPVKDPETRPIGCAVRHLRPVELSPSGP